MNKEDFDVSIYKSNNHEGYETVEIVIKSCVTTFDIKLQDLMKAMDAKSSHTKNLESIVFDGMVDKAFAHYDNGCK